MTRHFQKIQIDEGVKDLPLVKKAQSQFGDAHIVKEKEIISHFREGKSTLKLSEKKGEVFDTCSTMSKKYVCCNIKVIKAVKNCPYDCSYCFLQNYLNDGTTTVVSDIDAIMEEVIAKTEAQPWRLWRIGSWELGDSLALEDETGQAAALVEAFSKLPNAVLELKTKSNKVNSLLELDHKEKTVVAWSLNTEHIVNHQEHRTARLQERLDAIESVIKAGYPVAFHFDPMVVYDGWESGYTDLIQRLFEVVKGENIAWISVGSLRFNPEMKKKMEINFPKQTLTSEEMVLGDDGKVRYIKPMRLKLYRHITTELMRHLGVSSLSPLQEPSPNLPLFYYCMERPDVWVKTLGDTPEGIGHLDYLFARSMQTRYTSFSNLKPPSHSIYDLFQHS
jgi:spore photoproduct lyase